MRIRFLRRAGGHVVVAVLLAGRRNLQVAGQDLPGDGVVGVALDVGVPALRVHATPRPAHVPEQ